MKTPKVIIVAITVIILGFLLVYSQTGVPEKKEGHGAAAAGYGGGGSIAKAPMPRLAFISLPGDEGVIPPGANLQLLAGIEDIEKNEHHWIIVDCRDKESYNEGHIPSAIHLGETCNNFFRGDLEVKGKGVFPNLGMRPVAELEKKLALAGISMEKTVVFYDGKMGDAAAGKTYGILAGYAFVPFWFMEYLGHQDVRVLDGGIMAWAAAGKPLETKENRLASTVFKANVMKARLATTDDLARAGSYLANFQMVDTRTPAEYAGTSATPPNHFLEGKIAHAGHVPGVALLAPHFYQFVDMETMRLRPIWQLKRIYASLDPGKRTVAYCILGNRSSMAYFVMRLLGFKDPANYHDSWFVYGNTDGVPVEQSL